MIVKRKCKILLPLLVYAVIYMICFYLLERVEATSYYVPEIGLDYRIPFVPAFIIPYFMWFLWIPFICIYALFADESSYRKMSRMLIIVSALFPTKLHLRPSSVPEDSLFAPLVKSLYKTDTPTNVFPSIHVYNTLVLLYGIFLGDCKLFKNKLFRAFTALLSLSICLSTCFLKQHSVLDVIAAIVMLVFVALAYEAVARKWSNARESVGQNSFPNQE